MTAKYPALALGERGCLEIAPLRKLVQRGTLVFGRIFGTGLKQNRFLLFLADHQESVIVEPSR